MKAVYVSHPLRGDVQRNFNAVSDICANLKVIYQDLLILSPIHAFSFESVDGPQGWVLGQCLKLIQKADEIWLFGDWQNSVGCGLEREYALQLGKKIIDMTDAEEAESNEAILRRLA